LATTAQRAFTAGPTAAPRARQAPRPLRPSALFLWLSSLLFRISCYQFLLANFRHFTTPLKKKEKRLEIFVFFFPRLNKRKKKKIFLGQNLQNKKEKRLEIFVFFSVD
jgi:hypothetical protein